MSYSQLYNLIPIQLRNWTVGFSFKLYNSRIKRLFSEFIGPNDLVFDIGAHKGELTDVFLDLGARVVCVDPQPSCVEYLKTKYAKNKCVTIVDKGVANKPGVLNFLISSNSPYNSTFSKSWQKRQRYSGQKWDQQVQTRVTTLDKLIRQYGKPAFCKIDIEGFEEKALKGLTQKIKCLSFEFDEEFFGQTQACIRILDHLGKVKYQYTLYQSYLFASKSWLSGREIIAELKQKKNGLLRGDIYAKFDSVEEG